MAKIHKGSLRITKDLNVKRKLNIVPMTTVERDTLTPALGDRITNSDVGDIQFYNGTTWLNETLKDKILQSQNYSAFQQIGEETVAEIPGPSTSTVSGLSGDLGTIATFTPTVDTALSSVILNLAVALFPTTLTIQIETSTGLVLATSPTTFVSSTIGADAVFTLADCNLVSGETYTLTGNGASGLQIRFNSLAAEPTIGAGDNGFPIVQFNKPVFLDGEYHVVSTKDSEGNITRTAYNLTDFTDQIDLTTSGIPAGWERI